jgi:lipopolysaccharide export system protein LptA
VTARRAALGFLAGLLSLGVALASDAQTRTPPPKGKAPAPSKASEPKAAEPKAEPKAQPKTDPKPATAERNDRGPGRSSSPIVIDADHMEAMKKEGLVIFTGNVIAKQDNSVQTADRMEVYLDDRGERVLRIVSTGNVKIVTEDCRTGTARRAEYYDDDQRLLLIGDAKVWQDENVVTGDEIEMFLAEDRSTVKSGSRDRVKSVFYPKREEGAAEAVPTTTAKKTGKGAGSCG